MADTPDLAAIVNMIMENPALIAQISEMANKRGEDTAAEPQASEPASVKPEISVSAAAEPRRAHRARLLGALKPYLSEERGRAIDTMMSIADILEISQRR